MKKKAARRPKNTKPIVLIEWEDSAQAVPQWQWLEGATSPPLARCRSVGFLIRDTKNEKVLAISEANNFEQVSGIITVPSRCVTKLRRLA